MWSDTIMRKISSHCSKCQDLATKADAKRTIRNFFSQGEEQVYIYFLPFSLHICQCYHVIVSDIEQWKVSSVPSNNNLYKCKFHFH